MSQSDVRTQRHFPEKYLYPSVPLILVLQGTNYITLMACIEAGCHSCVASGSHCGAVWPVRGAVSCVHGSQRGPESTAVAVDVGHLPA